ncbi:coiled-coil domain-containing protein 172 isoform X2 [Gouania willdenowi]|uniref:Coiled-coil domain-containing protein 172 n=1 Tax=Gouania willdenowi TaxID=441366 RepID=A0A8C5E721_GOUWI|nr:coiled-coil domain-containing protein 172 isoform X2 [Gouania willdenowi]
MSLDRFFQQVLLSEQQLTEQTQKLKEVNVSIIRCKENIMRTTEKYEKTMQELDEKNQQLSTLRLHHHLMKKREEQMLKQTEELLRQNNHLREHLVKIKRDSKEEKERFLQEITRFNSDFSLQGKYKAVFQSRTHAELQEAERAVDSLHKEMEEIRYSNTNTHMVSIEEEKRLLVLELQGLESIQTELTLQLSDAKEQTQSLRAELTLIHQKPLTDSTCLSVCALLAGFFTSQQ